MVSHETNLTEQESSADLESTVLRITLNGEADETADVLRMFWGNQMPLTDYSIVPGELLGTTEMTMAVPKRSRSLLHINQAKPLEDYLAKIDSVLRVNRVKDAARHHVRLVVNQMHEDAREFTGEICRIGGHVNLSNPNIVKLSADGENLDVVIAVARTISGLVKRIRVNSVFSSVAHDFPAGGEVDVSKSPDFSADAKRYALRICMYYQFGEDSEIIDRIASAGFGIASVSSRIRENSGDIQEIVLMLYRGTGNDNALARIISEISALISVRNIEHVEEPDLSQYMQSLFPLGMKAGLEDVARSHPYFQNHGVMAHGLQLPVSGSSSPGRQARLNKSLAKADLPRRICPAIVNSMGLYLKNAENRRPASDLDFHESVKNGMLSLLRALPGRFDERGRTA